MSNYQQTTVAGEAWVRANSASIVNPVEGTKFISFQEEKAFVVAEGDVLTRPLGGLSELMTTENVGTEFPLLNPDTGEQVGTATYGQVYAMLHSLYIYLAKKRDENLAPIPAPAPEPAPVYPMD